MLTSAARDTLAAVQTVIVDEVHAVAGDQARRASGACRWSGSTSCLEKPAQRIGLSATVRPPEEVARFLSGLAPTTIVAPPAAKTFDLSVQVPVPDMANLENNTIWPDVEERIVDLIEAHRSRSCSPTRGGSPNDLPRGSTRFTPNATASSCRPDQPAGVAGGSPAHIMASGQASGAPPLLARAHHGSVSKEQRAPVEDDLKTGRLKAVVATSSLELGIDMGAVDLVIQVEAPPSVASGLQRIGRAGHQVGEISQGVLFPKHRTDLIGCAVTVQRMLAGRDRDHAGADQSARRAGPAHRGRLRAGAAGRRPLVRHGAAQRAVRDAAAQRVRGDAGPAVRQVPVHRVRRAAAAAGVRPRRAAPSPLGRARSGWRSPRVAPFPTAACSPSTWPGRADSEKPSRVGELDEEMVYESRPGDVISLGATSWRITEITHDRVLVIPAPGQPARLPFWRGDGVGRPAELGAAIGAFTGELARLGPDGVRRTLPHNGFRRLRGRQPVAAAR